MNRVIGVAVLAVGVVLLVFAYRSTNAPLEQLSETITGRYSDGTMWYFAAGVAAVVGGGLLAMLGSRK
jgi:drug/metabolite transporter (DMT)-like permease